MSKECESDEKGLIGIAQEFISWDPNPDTRDEMMNLVTQKDMGALQQRLGKRIAFGTAGLRARMGAGYALMNDLVVLQTTQGIAVYLEAEVPNCHKKGVLIGYDARYHSNEFAEIAATVLISRGFRVYLCQRFVPTPLVPFGILELGCAAGIMITASHNPKQDNGYKVYWRNGAQIIPPHDAGIAKSILSNLEPWLSSHDLDKSHELLSDPTDRLCDQYFKEIQRRYCFHRNENSSALLRVCYTAMHGVGGIFVSKAFEAFGLPPYIPVKEQQVPDPEFPTVVFPNPEEGQGVLDLAEKTADKSDCTLILANDPDADRLAVAVKSKRNGWKILTGNEIAALFADWIWKNWRRVHPDKDPAKATMLASTVSSKFLGAMAKEHGFSFLDTLTGFKWLGNTAIEAEKHGHEFLFAYEVEIGFLVGNTSYDKDGVRTAAIFYEMANLLWSQNITILEHLETLRKKYGYFEMINSYFYCDTNEKLIKVFKNLRSGGYPDHCGPYKIVSVRDVTTGFDSSKEDKKSTLPVCPDQQMLTFYFENGSIATMRNSGTEPKLKYYIECSHKDSQEVAQQLLHEMNAIFVAEFLKPEENGLVSRGS